MAFIDKGWFLDTEWIDTGGNKTRRTFQLTAATVAGSIATVIADVQIIVAAWIAATDAVLVSQRVTSLSVEDSVVLPAGDVNVEENAQISAKIFGTPNKSAVFEIPAPKNTIFRAPTGEGHNQVDFTKPIVAAVVNIYKDGEQALISDGESITDQDIRGKRVHHKSTKG
jgi:hypothetical protein